MQKSKGWDGVPFDPSRGRYFLRTEQSHNQEARQKSPSSHHAEPTPAPISRKEGLQQLRSAMQIFDGSPPKATPPPQSAPTQAPPGTQPQAPTTPPPASEAPAPQPIKVDSSGPLGWRKIDVRPSLTEKALLDAETSLKQVREEMGDCQRCQLSKQRQHLVFGAGKARTRLMLVGEAPEAKADETGSMFVGKEDLLIENMLRAIGVQKEDVYVTHIVKCRPPQNRHPLPGDVNCCVPFLWKQIDAVQPEIILTMGTAASQTVLGSNKPFGRLRSKWVQVKHIWVLPIFHPAYLLRNPKEKAKAWSDLQMVMHRLSSSDEAKE